VTRDAVIVGAEELPEATSAWLAVAVVKQRRNATGLAAIRAKRRACIFYILNFFGGEEGDYLDVKEKEKWSKQRQIGMVGVIGKVLHKQRHLSYLI
jgi:hypothetical protein